MRIDLLYSALLCGTELYCFADVWPRTKAALWENKQGEEQFSGKSMWERHPDGQRRALQGKDGPDGHCEGCKGEQLAVKIY